jgi:NodT family efflux transporter outer membrane factor (OMF) lipoprotein
VRKKMEELKASFPEGMGYSIVYDPTRFVQTSIEKVVETLIEAVLLVVLVVIVFLQTWRASLIPLLAVPVSIVGTLFFLLLLGYSINTLTLFGLVLAIGIVVDDAIVVVENAERNIEAGLSPHDATVKAMQEVSGPIIAIALVLCAVFVPLAFVPGLTGQFYKQFAVTIAISTVISAFNSLTLSPALSALLLRPVDAPPDRLTRWMDAIFGRFFRWFNGWFKRRGEDYARGVGGIVRRKSLALVVYAVLLGLTAVLFLRLPAGFVPAPDKQYLIGIAQLPAGASLDRTEAVIRRMSDIALKVPGIVDAVAFPGPLDRRLLGGAERGDRLLRPQALRRADLARALEVRDPRPRQRRDPGDPGRAHVRRAAARGRRPRQRRRLQGPGAGPRRPRRAGALRRRLGRARPGLRQPEVEHRHAVLDLRHQRAAALRQRRPGPRQADGGAPRRHLRHDAGQPRLALRQRLQQVRQDLPGDRPGRRAVPRRRAGDRRAEDEERRRRHGAARALMTVEPTFGPTRVTRYNGYPSADINGAAKPGFSSGEAEAEIETLLKRSLPRGVGYEWTELTYQDRLTRDITLQGTQLRMPILAAVMLIAVLLVVLVLAAQYESWSLPLAIVLIVPMCVLAALFGVWISHFPPFAQPGRPQHLHPGGAGRARRPGVQERDPDRRVRQGARGARRGGARRRRARVPDAAAPDPDDLDRVHRRRHAAHLRQRRGQRDAPRHGHRGVLGDARRDRVRHLPDAGVLRAAARPQSEVPRRPRTGSQGWRRGTAGPCRRRPCRPGSRLRRRRRKETAMRDPVARRLAPLAGALLLAGLFTGCAVGPNYEAPAVPLDAAFLNGASTAPRARRRHRHLLARLRRPAPDAAGRARPRRERRRSHRRGAPPGGAREPARRRGRAAARDRRRRLRRPLADHRIAAPRRLARRPHEQRFDAGFTASWELDLFGRNRRASEAAAAQLDASAAGVHAAQTAVAAEVARNYLELRGLQQRLEVARQSLVNQRDTLRLTGVRLDAGRGTRFDVARAQSQLDSTEATLPALQAAIDRTAYRLATLTAQPPRVVAGLVAAPQLLPTLPVTDLSALPLGTPEQLLRRRPDLVAAERQLAAATAGIGIATADLFPRVSLTGLIGFASNRVVDLGGRDSQQYSLGAALSWPILDFGRVRSRIAASEARAAQSLAGYEQAVQIALEETEGALSQFTRSAEQAERLASAARNAEEATRLSRRRFDAGAVDLLVVLDAERQALVAREALVQSQVGQATALVAIYRALGGGWTDAAPAAAMAQR